MKLNKDLYLKNTLSGNETDKAPSVAIVKSNIDTLTSAITWKTLKSNQSQGSPLSLPTSNIHEIFVRVKINNDITQTIPFLIPYSALLSGTYQNFRLGDYFTGNVYHGASLKARKEDIYFADAYSGGTYQSNSKMDVFYR